MNNNPADQESHFSKWEAQKSHSSMTASNRESVEAWDTPDSDPQVENAAKAIAKAANIPWNFASAQDCRTAARAALPFLAPQPSQSETCVRNSPQTSDTSYDVQAQAERPPSESDNYIDAELWRDLCEKSDRTSPEGQPDMALINQSEFFDYLAAVRAEATLAGAVAEREACAKVADELLVDGDESACTHGMRIAATIRARAALEMSGGVL